LRAGQKAAVLVQDDRLLSLRLPLAPDHDVVVARDYKGDFVAEDQDRPTHEVKAFGTGLIHSSLSEAADRADVPAAVLEEMIRALSYDVDFQREVQPGDSFTVLYHRVDDEFGRPTNRGTLIYAEMVLSGKRIRLYRFTPKDGEPGYFNALGENTRKSLLRTPIDGARLSSGFGMRFHPILGYSRMHKGVDFAAPKGTVVYAAGDGVVERVGKVRGYGNYIEIRHNKEYETAYGHLSGFAKNLHQGEHVQQGEVIGYVGMTGLATGPHLHYEVHYHGTQINPLSVKMPAMTKLAGDDLKAFQAARSATEADLSELRRDLIAAAQ
jgi:murein DD-endopeptidase MepM/ murein hydrolase activator NlpD